MIISAIVWLGWLATFAVLEILAWKGWAPWHTLSEFTWYLEDIWAPFAYVMVASFAVLLTHLIVAKFH